MCTQELLWQRSKTTRRYLQPLKSERHITLWAGGVLIYGDIIEAYDFDFRSVSGGVWLLYGEDAQPLDFKSVKNIITDDGTPIHALEFRCGQLTLTMEAFCNTQRKSTCFVKITAKNNGSAQINEKLSLLLRTGKENELGPEISDGYRSYSPETAPWFTLASVWKYENGVFTDGERTLVLKADGKHTWDENRGMISLPVSLEPDESKDFMFSMDKGEVRHFDYEDEKSKMHAFWQNELARINKLPRAITDNAEAMKMIRHIIALLLQCFTYPVGKNYLLALQGGFRRMMWPTEEMTALEALGIAGDFSEYIEAILGTYFDVMQVDSGEIKNIGVFWASITGCALYSFAKYCETAGADFYNKYRDKAFMAFRWIQRTRNGVCDSDGIAGGLFPALRSTDYDFVFQGWTATDPFNIMAIKEFAKVTEMFKDSEAADVKKEHESYVETIRRHFRRHIEAAGNSEELYIPMTPFGSDHTLVYENFYPRLFHGRFIYCGAVENKKDIYRIYKNIQNDGIANDGFYGHMTPLKSGDTHIWYMSFPDYYWFLVWQELGEWKKAEEILLTQLRYGITSEYYLMERYKNNDPYFVPYLPNASASGRLIIMLNEAIRNGFFSASVIDEIGRIRQ